MGKNRLEAFSDGVLAIIITIMVLQLAVPKEPTFAALLPMLPIFLGYLLSFVYVAIYWNNHHHLLQAGKRVTGSVLWANLHLLFWLSLLPFATRWMGDNHLAPLPSMAYGVILLASAIAYWLLQRRIIAADGHESTLRQALGSDWKGRLSPLLYLVGIAATVFNARLGQAFYTRVALLWLIPERRIEHELQH